MVYTGMLTPAVDVLEDDAGGAYVVTLNPVTTDGDVFEVRLRRLNGAGNPAPGWPAGGHVQEVWNFFSADAVGPHLVRRRWNGVYLGTFEPRLHVPAVTKYVGWAGTGIIGSSSEASPYDRRSVVDDGMGGLFVAGVIPNGACHYMDPYAKLSVAQVPAGPGWTGINEIHTEQCVGWYGAVALASTGDGGVFFVWSQNREQFGLFVKRFTPPGSVSVPPAATGLALSRCWYDAGGGVRAVGETSASGPASLDLFDTSGRKVASQRVASGVFDVMLPGTVGIAPGVYFLRLSEKAGAVRARVAVVR
jgi:hypothetical protein